MPSATSISAQPCPPWALKMRRLIPFSRCWLVWFIWGTYRMQKEMKASEMLGMEAHLLGGALLRRKLRVQHAGRESVHEVPRTTSQFRHALHSLIKALYKRLFERLVQRINSSFGEARQAPEEDDQWHQIGILDIYGFERLQRNSLEQLCINLANERLQQYFVETLSCS
eukprot:symbB.v1.2.030629.t1/scaffold3475.1/size55991/1